MTCTSHPGVAGVRASGSGSPCGEEPPTIEDVIGNQDLPVCNAAAGSVSPAAAPKGRFGAAPGQKPHRGKQVTVAEFRRMWFDSSMTVADIAKTLDICTRSVWQRARHRGLPLRTDLIKPGPAPTLDRAAEAMWRACVRAEDIADAYGVTVSAVHQHMHRGKVDRQRVVSRWHPAMTLADFRAVQLREAMAVSARETVGAMACAEMLDDPRRALRRAA